MSDPNKMSFLEHLEELRWRVVRSLVAIVLVAILAFIFKGVVFDVFILAPKDPDFITYRFFCALSHRLGLSDAFCLSTTFQLQNIDMSGQFTSHIMVSIVTGIVVAFPYVFYQFWSFVAPGLKASEKSTARGAVLATSVLFFLGVAFGYLLIAPLSVQFLGNYSVSEQVENIIRLNSFISIVTMTSLSGGIVFQLPIVIYFLAELGLVTPQVLRKYRRHAIVGVLIISAVITPPDISSQILVSLPLIFLYEVSIYIAKIVTLRKERRAKSPA